MKLVAPYTIDGVQSVTIEEAYESLKTMKTISIDVETTGLDPHIDKIIMLQLGDLENQYIVDTRYQDPSLLFELISDPSILKVGANLKFEYKMFLGNWRIRLHNFFDVCVAEQVLECGLKMRGFSLAALSEKYLSKVLPKDVRMEFTKIKGQPFNKRQVTYGCNDIIYPLKLLPILQKRVNQDDLFVCNRLEQRFVQVVGEMEFNGMYVDKDRWREIYTQNQNMSKEMVQQLDDYLIDNKVTRFLGPYDLFTGKPSVIVNWGSPKQVVEVFKYFNVPTKVEDKVKSKKLGKKVFKDSVSVVEIGKYAKDYPIVDLFLKYSKYEKAAGTFGKKWEETHIHERTGRVHSSFWSIQKTGRMSSNNPNIQQIPSVKSKESYWYEKHRTAFSVPEGRTLVVRDYSGQELRVMSSISKEDSMIKEFNEGTGDLHSLTASKVYSTLRGEHVEVSKKVNGDLRTIGKMLNFAISYGASAYKIAQGAKCSEEEAENIIESFFTAFPKLNSFFTKGHHFVKENGYVLIDEFTKRRSYIPGFKEFKELEEMTEVYRQTGTKPPKSHWSRYFTLKGSMERASQNYRIQGSSASMTKMSLIFMYDYLKKEDLFGKIDILLALHDEIVLEADDEYAELANDSLNKFMVEAGNYFSPLVPMISDGGTTKVWDH